MSTHDNSFIRYFKGHQAKLSEDLCFRFAQFEPNPRVQSLEMSPVDDTFLSAAMDDTVRLWDLRSPNCQVRLYYDLSAS